MKISVKIWAIGGVVLAVILLVGSSQLSSNLKTTVYTPDAEELRSEREYFARNEFDLTEGEPRDFAAAALGVTLEEIIGWNTSPCESSTLTGKMYARAQNQAGTVAPVGDRIFFDESLIFWTWVPDRPFTEDQVALQEGFCS